MKFFKLISFASIAILLMIGFVNISKAEERLEILSAKIGYTDIMDHPKLEKLRCDDIKFVTAGKNLPTNKTIVCLLEPFCPKGTIIKITWKMNGDTYTVHRYYAAFNYGGDLFIAEYCYFPDCPFPAGEWKIIIKLWHVGNDKKHSKVIKFTMPEKEEKRDKERK